jgi:hypothetical protein
MRFTLLWRPSADATLIDLWISNSDRDMIGRAADEIDSLLTTSPLDVGESRTGSTRILIVPPLGVFYDVNEADRRVTVWSVWLTQKEK